MHFRNSACVLLYDVSTPQPHHDVKIEMFTGFFPRKQRQVLELQLIWVIEDGSRIESSLQNGHIIFDPCWSDRED